MRRPLGPQAVQLVVPVRDLAAIAAREMGKEATFTGSEADTALLGNSEAAFELFGPPSIEPEQIVKWMVPWVAGGGASLNKPTKYEHRDGKF